jgi:ArsR family transcriptional regulator
MDDKKPGRRARRCVTSEELRDAPVPGSAKLDQDLAKLAWALAHPARVRILRILLCREACVCGELVDQFDLAQSTVSQHLKILKESGLVQGEVEGPKVCYCVNRAALERLKSLIAGL